jgi:hypothetical protein
MKKTIIICLAIMIFWSFLALMQLWFLPFSARFFVKVSITAGILEVIILIVGLCHREYVENKKMEDDNYID